MHATRSIFTVLSVVLIYPTVAEGQLREIDLIFEQQSIGNGNVEYGLRVRGSVLFSFVFFQGSLTAPDGTVFDSGNLSERGFDFEQLGSRFFGDWSVAGLDFNTGDIATHTFTVSPFTLDNVFSEIPTIVSPALSGEQITITSPSGTARFVLDWNYPSGIFPHSRLLTSSDSGGGTSSSSFISNSNSASVAVVLDPGILSSDFSYRAGAIDVLGSFVSSVQTDDPNASSVYRVDALFWNLSQPLTVTVSVPEPGSLVLTAVAAMGLFMRTRSFL